MDYIGYKRVHPLEDKIIINILSSKYKDIDSIINNIFVHGCNSIIKHLKELQSDLEKQKEFVKELKSIKPINF